MYRLELLRFFSSVFFYFTLLYFIIKDNLFSYISIKLDLLFLF
jgi:hypothetical protein